jgi:LPXTG-site transpeptidase (sortase) family protein
MRRRRARALRLVPIPAIQPLATIVINQVKTPAKRHFWSRVQPKLLLHPLSLGILAGLAVITYITFSPAQAHLPKQVFSPPKPTSSIQKTAPSSTPAAPAAGVTRSTNRLIIPAIGVNSPMISVGLVDGNLGTPKTLYQVAQYTGGAQPGQLGTTIIDGHSGAPGQNGVFHNLDRLKAGDMITVKVVSGTTYTYQVTSSQAYDLSQASAHKLFDRSAKATLNIVSCTGTWSNSSQSYNERWIVTSQLAQ